ncbi:MAG: hypothetical protein DRI90_23250 [Deltaproteobacteria bacterium]|nr:MAG: hypothetical protein DRI90_23250 [Deltaproteobacteria bacterium]
MPKLPAIWPSTADAVWQIPTADDWSIAIHVYGDPAVSRPAVALFHGALSNSRSFDVGGFGLAPFLRDRGYNAFSVDFRGRGHSLPPPWSTGWTIDDLIQRDVPAAVAAICRRAGVEQVHAVGHSLGGMALFGALAIGSPGIDRVVTLGASATLDIPPTLRRVVEGLSHFSMIPIAALGEKMGFLARWIPHPLWRWCCNPHNVELEPFRLFLTCGSGDIAVRKMLHLKRICDEGRLVSADGTVDYSSRMGMIRNPIHLFGATADTFVAPRLIDHTATLLASAPTELTWCGQAQGCEHDYGHLDLVLGKNAEQEVFAKIVDFLGLPPSQSTCNV